MQGGSTAGMMLAERGPNRRGCCLRCLIDSRDRPASSVAWPDGSWRSLTPMTDGWLSSCKSSRTTECSTSGEARGSPSRSWPSGSHRVWSSASIRLSRCCARPPSGTALTCGRVVWSYGGARSPSCPSRMASSPRPVRSTRCTSGPRLQVACVSCTGCWHMTVCWSSPSGCGASGQVSSNHLVTGSLTLRSTRSSRRTAMSGSEKPPISAAK